MSGLFGFDYSIIDMDNNQICNISKDNVFNNDTNEANARLIAAAPDLLDALKCATACLTKYNDVSSFKSFVDRWEQVIGETEGK